MNMNNRRNIFSVIIPVYNAERTIERTLASLISNRDYIHEVILVNDKSTDRTFEKIKQFQNFFEIKVLDNQYSKGVGTARKTGLMFSTGKWITFVDADDCLTSSSLYYVYKQLNNNKDIVLLHSKSIYYESGNFNADAIEYSDTSCGGNFYKKSYLLKNNLLPHDTLAMAEDEYFNEKIIKYITYCDKRCSITHFNYPVYEVHHDNEFGLSFALSNWADYCCKYHLLYKEYLTSDFIENKNMEHMLLEEYMDSFIFCYFLSQGLMSDEDVNFKLEEHKKYFKRALDYFVKTFQKSEQYLIDYFKDDESNTNAILQSAYTSIGFVFDININFIIFVQTL